MCFKILRVIYIYDVYDTSRLDRLGAPCFPNYFESELFFRNGPFIKITSFLHAQKMLSIGEQQDTWQKHKVLLPFKMDR